MNMQERGVVVGGKVLSEDKAKQFIRELVSAARTSTWLLDELLAFQHGDQEDISPEAKEALQKLSEQLPIYRELVNDQKDKSDPGGG